MAAVILSFAERRRVEALPDAAPPNPVQQRANVFVEQCAFLAAVAPAALAVFVEHAGQIVIDLATKRGWTPPHSTAQD